MHIALLLLLMSSAFRLAQSDDDLGAEYLQNAIRDIQKMQQAQHSTTNRRSDNYKSVPSIPKLANRPPLPAHPPTVPPLSLTKGELSAIYEAASTKGQTINLSSDNGPPINALVHTIDDQPPTGGHVDFAGDSTKQQSNAQGYYYYYYPLHSFMEESNAPGNDIDVHSNLQPLHAIPTQHPPLPQQLFHSHTHQHNVHIATPYHGLDVDKKHKGVEPLFMAISGFVGMAVMFVISVVLLPKFGLGGLRRSGVKPPPPGEVTNIARIAMEAIEGRDCAERLACEIGKRAKAMNLYDNRLFRRIAPPSVARAIDRVGKYTTKKNRCITIRCKRKPPAVPVQQKQSKTQPSPKKNGPLKTTPKPKTPPKFRSK